MTKQRPGAAKGGSKDCPRCRRTRWILTIIILLTMSAILFLDQFSASQ